MTPNNPVRLISVTTPQLEEFKNLSADELLAAIARVSNPNNQTNTETMPKMLKYCIDHKHWSVFEMVDMTVEITTSRMIAAQILRHRSFTFQEFSQRYAKVTDFVLLNPRRQDTKNRQNSIDDLDESIKQEFKEYQNNMWSQAKERYNYFIEKGVAKECARGILPLNTETTLYMKGNVRSWMHYLEIRTDPSTQLEHREIAVEIKKIFVETFPIVASALNWKT
jgi:thymidylate synthase (FAD)